MSDYVYKLGEDPDNTCIMIPRYRSEGRTAPNGKQYPKFSGKESEDDLVPVRSIVTKSKELGVVTPDLVSTLYHYDLKDDDPIGISFATSLTQAITQTSLSLKHKLKLCHYVVIYNENSLNCWEHLNTSQSAA